MDDILVTYVLLAGNFLLSHDQGYHNEQISHYYWKESCLISSRACMIPYSKALTRGLLTTRS